MKLKALGRKARAPAQRLIARAYPKWAAAQVAEELEQAWCVGAWVRQTDDQEDALIGWLSASLHPPAAELRLLAVDPDHRHRGVGTSLVTRLLNEIRQSGCSEVVLEVRASNRAARGLYATLGFENVGIRKGYYRSPPEDGVVLRWDVTCQEGQTSG